MIVIVEGVGMIWGVLLHLNESVIPRDRWPWLEPFIITPSAHRIHHARNDIYVDTNYGLTFSIWDHLFSTDQRRVRDQMPEYGLQKQLDSANLIVSQTDEFACLWRDIRSAPRLLDKLAYLVMPPGWNHRDGGRTAKQIRAAALTEATNQGS